MIYMADGACKGLLLRAFIPYTFGNLYGFCVITRGGAKGQSEIYNSSCELRKPGWINSNTSRVWQFASLSGCFGFLLNV